MSKYRPVQNPNLPQGNVKAVAVGEPYIPLVYDALCMFGIDVTPIPICNCVDVRVSGHADISTHHLGGSNLIVSADTYSETYNNLEKMSSKFGLGKWSIIRSSAAYDPNYPGDVHLNALRIGKFLFCNTNHTDVRLLEYCRENAVEIVHVNQGYSRCSVCVVSKSAAITADTGLAEAMEQKGIDVLKIRRGFIDLPGFDYGFIGGASGKISRDKLCFTGSLNDHPDKTIIENFIRSHGVEPVVLTSRSCIDIGSIIPLIETDESE